MAWFRNYYICARCASTWTDEWSAMCEDDCPDCGARHMTALKSENLTEVIEPEGADYVVLKSPETAEYDPQYRELARFRTWRGAEAFLRN
jgi:DNA-directed RNA polymerase subunit RPC12/RpoP